MSKSTNPGTALSPRQLEILQDLADGFVRKQIAERKSVSIGTLNDHMKAIFTKLRVHSQQAAVAKGLRSQIIV
jgi:DNA-binding NarL/FixJ family response regulator